MKVSWADYSQYMESHKIPWFQTTNQIWMWDDAALSTSGPQEWSNASRRAIFGARARVIPKKASKMIERGIENRQMFT